MRITLSVPCRRVENKHIAVLNECELAWGKATWEMLCAGDSSIVQNKTHTSSKREDNNKIDSCSVSLAVLLGVYNTYNTFCCLAFYCV